MSRTLFQASFISLGSLFIATPALAHTGGTTEASLIAGLTHPLTGIDHLLAMFAIGIWTAMQHRTDHSKVPAVFLIMLMAGFLLGMNGLAIPFVEAGIASSVLIMGLAIVFATKLPNAASLPLISLFALYHGTAHGFEIGIANATYFAVGFITSSALLNFAGVRFTKLTNQLMPKLHRVVGSIIALAGFSFLIA